MHVGTWNNNSLDEAAVMSGRGLDSAEVVRAQSCWRSSCSLGMREGVDGRCGTSISIVGSVAIVFVVVDVDDVVMVNEMINNSTIIHDSDDSLDSSDDDDDSAIRET